jgi:phage terminase large subunit GpA-like protein
VVDARRHGAQSFLEAKKLPETLKTWINTSLGETWEEKGDTVEAAACSPGASRTRPTSSPPACC